MFALSRDLHMAFSEILLVIKAGEMLELVETSRNQVKLTAMGKQALAGTLQIKKDLLRGQMLKLAGVPAHREADGGQARQ